MVCEMIRKYGITRFYLLCKYSCTLYLFNESLKGFEMKPLRVFSDSPRDKNFRGFPYE